MLQTFKDNLFIVLGITLPVLLIVVVLAIRGVNSWANPDPAYMLVYAISYGSYGHSKPSINYRASDGTLVLRYKPETEESYHKYNARLELHLFSYGRNVPINRDQVQVNGWRADYEKNMNGQHIKLVYRPRNFDQDQLTTKLDFLSNDEFHLNREAPDGYKFTKRDRHHRGGFTHFFSPDNYRDSRYLIYKQTRYIPVPVRRYRNVDFLAWVKPEQAGE